MRTQAIFSRPVRPIVAKRVPAEDWVLNGAFRAVFDYVRIYFDHLAYQTALRKFQLCLYMPAWGPRRSNA